MYRDWFTDPKSVHASWDAYFKNLHSSVPSDKAFIHPDQFAKILSSLDNFSQPQSFSYSHTELVHKVTKLINFYRAKGHYLADLDPLKIKLGVPKNPENLTCLSLEDNGIGENESNTKVDLSALGKFGFHAIKREWTPLEVLKSLKDIYCGKISYQYNHICSEEAKEWIQARVEKAPAFTFDKEKKLNLLERILESQAFSLYCERKYSTYKRYGCDGLDSGISALGNLVQQAAKRGIKETIFGMPHRGRLNVLCCVLKKPYQQIFAEFEDIHYMSESDMIYRFSGDLKYHLGCSNKLNFANGSEMILNLLPNPSHLEAVYPIVLGSVKGRQTKLGDEKHDLVLPVIIHGDAALAGQGVIYEAQQMEKLSAYEIGGAIHLVFNNQIGFTTDQNQGRSCVYPTNIAIINNNFIIHVNAHEPESVDFAMELALDYRMKFKTDVFINLVGFRKHGHNEQDTPTFTQPEMYHIISKTEPMYLSYADRLIGEGIIARDYFEQRLKHYLSMLETQHNETMKKNLNATEWDPYGWKDILNSEIESTGISKETFENLGKIINRLPNELNAHKTIKKIYEERYKSIVEGKNVDWATAESLAFASLLQEGHSIRLCGEDTERGAFSHRHAFVFDQVNYAKFMPLKQILKEDSKVNLTISNSLLSEYGALAFEYGHSLALPNDLTIWEAQFGDFLNGAQIIVDQFITAGEKKWGRMNGLCLFLPHGADGQGPEHTNCHLERVLAAVEDDFNAIAKDESTKNTISSKINMMVCNVTNPANFFHLLRRQLKKNYRKPLFLLSHKKLLRHKLVRSSVEEFLNPNKFIKVYDEHILKDRKSISKILICSGQVYFDLLEKREIEKISDVAIIRLEQIGPFPYNAFESIIKTYNKNVDVVFVSEESMNFSAWSYLQPRIDLVLKNNKMKNVRYVGRPISAAPATGSINKFKAELITFLEQAFK